VPGSVTTQLHGGMVQGGSFSVKTFSQEFRLASNGTGHFNYLFGAYYSNEDLTRDFRRGIVGNTNQISNYRGETHYGNYALFGQTAWTFLPRTTLITGLRFNREESSYLYDNYYKVFRLPGFGMPTSNVDSVTTGKLGLQYQVTDDIMAFGFAAKGYKGVAYDLVTATTPQEAALFPIKSEKSNDYELGVRSEWLNHRLVLNGTVYDTEYSNFQVQTIVPNLLNTFILTNVPKVRSRGAEFEGFARITDDIRFNLGYAYTDARAVTYPIGQCYSGQTAPATCLGKPAFQDLAGATLPNAPKHKINAGFDYTRAVPGLPLDGDLNLTSVWQSDENFSITKDPGTVQKAYDITNLSLTLTPQHERRFSLTLFCNNLFDKHYAANLNNVRSNYTFPSSAGTAYTQEVPRDFFRYYGLRVGFTSL
jgi:iron complex outermembrane receptor protein